MMKLPRILRRKKLRATALRRPLRSAAAAGYDDLSEPNMKLSRALLVVLLLHIVAVAGIIAFNAIKMRQTATAHALSARANAAPAPAASTIAAMSSPSGANPTEHVKRAEPVTAATDSRKTYVVARGDNPVTIAKKFKVSYDELLALNHIDDPRKLRVGQKLVIPTKSKAKKTGE